MPTVLEEVRSRGGAARRAELLRVLPLRELRAAARRGDVLVAAGGTLHLPDVDPVILTAVVHGGVVTCVSAAQLAGLPVLVPPDLPHVAVPRSRGDAPSGPRDTFPAVRHRTDPRRARSSRRPVAPLAEALARMLLCCPEREALVAVDGALVRGWTSVAAIRHALPATATAKAVLSLGRAERRSRSAPETLARLALRAAGLHVRAGVVLPGVGEVDLLVEECVVVEIDGYAFHSDRAAFVRDRRRDRALAALGYPVLRFTYADALEEHGLVADVRAALRVRHLGPPARRGPSQPAAPGAAVIGRGGVHDPGGHFRTRSG